MASRPAACGGLEPTSASRTICSGQIEIFAIDRNGQKSVAVQTIPLAD